MTSSTKVTAPFSRSVLELRRTFSEGRLCERDNFGSLGKKLITWRKGNDHGSLEGLSLAELEHYLHKMNFELNTYLLAQTVTSVSKDTEMARALFDAPEMRGLQPMLQVFIETNGIAVYAGLRKSCLVCINEHANYGIRSDCHFGSSESFTVIEPINAKNASAWVGDLIMAEIHHKRPKAAICRSVLISILLNAMQNIINAANEDFDKAVAVSDDGSRIVHADIVYIYSDNAGSRCERVLWPKQCKDSKVLRVNEGFLRTRSNSPHDQVVMEGSLMGCTQLLEDNQRNGRKEFHVRRGHVPNKLLSEAEPYNPGMHVL